MIDMYVCTMYFPELTILNTNQRVIRLQEQIPGVLVVFFTLIIYYLSLLIAN